MSISPKKFLRQRLRRVYKLRFLHKLSLYSVIASHLDNSRYRGYNWWDEYASLFWLPRFIDLYFEPKKKINLFSSFRKPLRFIRHYKGVNIFLSGENLPTIASTSVRRIHWAKATSQRRSSTAYARGVSPSIGVLT